MDQFGTIQMTAVITENNNFKNFFNSFILLIRITTNDNWGDVMYNLSISGENCKDYQTYEELMEKGPQGCGSFISFLFFIIFILLIKLIIMNLFIAVVVDTFMTRSSKSDKIDDVLIQNFFTLWGKYDTEIQYYITPAQLVLILMELEYPMGLKNDPEHWREFDKRRQLIGNIHICHSANIAVDDKQCIRILNKLNIVCRDDKLYLIDAIIFLTKRAMKDYITENKIDELQKYSRVKNKLEGYYGDYYKGYKNIISKQQVTKSSNAVAKKIIRRHLLRWRLNRKIKSLKKK
jgi:hypothetical protein